MPKGVQGFQKGNQLGNKFLKGHKCFCTGRTFFKKGISWGNHTQEFKDHLRKIALKKGYKPPVKFGKDHPLWKGGKTRNQHAGLKYKQWRDDVYKRDNYTCQDCKIKGGYLQAHHIKSWAKYSKLRYKIKNGITLHLDCHKKIHYKRFDTVL
jgi:hypothetical protein